MKRNLLFIGHRGTIIDYNENTLKSFEAAIKSGAQYIEFDVRRLNDGNLLVFHDAFIDKTIVGLVYLKDLTYAEFKNLKTKIRTADIPLLTEVLDKLAKRTKFMIDIKEEEIKNDVINMVVKKGLLKDCVICGRNYEILRITKKEFPKCQVCYNITKGTGLSLKEFIELGNQKNLRFIPDMISLKSNLIEANFIAICHENGIKALAWGFIKYANSVEMIKDLIKLQIDGILFDDHKNIKIIKQWLKRA